MIWKSTGTLFTTFTSCSTALQTLANTGNAAADKAKLIALNTAFTILTYFESKYKCSGICKTALFYYSIDLSAGMPTQNCLIFLK